MPTHEPIEHSIRSGVHLSNYQILSHLVSGNTGEFWLALKRSGGEGQIYVAKTLQARLDMDHTFVERFWHQAMQASRLEHGNIAQLFDGGMSSGVQFVIMEYVPGRSLDHIMLKRPVPPLWFTLKAGIQICDALHYAHTLKDPDSDAPPMIHGCLAPKKVMVSCNGVVKILGFGIAQVASMIQDIPSTVRLSRFAYLSPEHLRGVTLDHRCDIYGVGVLLYEMLTGMRPFSGNSVFHLIQRIAEGNPKPITQINPAVPIELEEIVLKAMHARAEKRHQDAGELRDELMDVFNSLSARSSTQVLSTFLRDLFPEIPWSEKDQLGSSQLGSSQLGSGVLDGSALEPDGDEVTKTGGINVHEAGLLNDETTSEHPLIKEGKVPPEAIRTGLQNVDEVLEENEADASPMEAAPPPPVAKQGKKQKSVQGVKSAKSKPAPVAKPATIAKPATVAKPATAAKPATVAKPSTDAKSAAGTKAVTPPPLAKPSSTAPKPSPAGPQKVQSRPVAMPSLAKPTTSSQVKKAQEEEQARAQQSAKASPPAEAPTAAPSPAAEAPPASADKGAAADAAERPADQDANEKSHVSDIFSTYASSRKSTTTPPFTETKKAPPSEGLDIFSMYAAKRAAEEEQAAQEPEPEPEPEPQAPPPSGGGPVDVFSLYGSKQRQQAAQDPFSPPSKNPFAPTSASSSTDKAGFGGSSAVRHFEQGLVHYRAGKYTDALVEWERALELDPENRTYRSNLQRLRSILENK